MKPISLYGKTHPGKRRKDNQDAFLCMKLWTDDNALLLVVDGVGGYAGGEKAAAIARTSIEEYMKVPKGDIMTMLREAVIYANNRIAEERTTDPAYREMCCVLTAAVADVSDETLYYVHVGDTRLYLFSNKKLKKLTRDHSFVGIHEDAGELTEDEAMHHPQRNQILREVGSAIHRIDDTDFMDFGKQEFRKNDTLLICSDGLTDMIASKVIENILIEKTTLPIKAGKLIDKANEMGGHDNITVVLLENHLSINNQLQKPADEIHTDKTDTALKDNSQKKTKSLTRHIIRSILLLIFISGTGWYYYSEYWQQQATSAIDGIPDSKNNTAASEIRSDSLTETVFFTSRNTNPATPVPEPEKATDTIRIRNTQHLSYLQHYADSTGKKIMLLPEKKGKPVTAVKITGSSLESGDTIVLRDLYLKDFENGFSVEVDASLKMDNIIFENIRYPLVYSSSGKQNKSTVIIINSGKK